VIRGGGWNNNAQNCRSAIRNNDDAGNRNNDLGFRLVSTEFPPDKRRSRTALLCIRFVQAIVLCRWETAGRITTEPPRLVVSSETKVVAALFYFRLLMFYRALSSYLSEEVDK
jgi:hypothetical protein